jgi:FkbM family methyltransferase
MRAAKPRRTTLAGGLEVFHLGRFGETRFIHREIFEDRVYLQHGVTLDDDAVVVDVGANIGLFSVFALRERARLRLYAFEPIPETFAALERNLALHAGEGSVVKAFGHGLSRASGTAELTFYPFVPGNSTMRPDEKETTKRLLTKELVDDGYAHAKPLWLFGLLFYPFRRPLVRAAVELLYRPKRVACSLRTLSEVIDDEGIERVDLLKIDVEGAELDVLRGIREAHWPRIRQVVMEVHDTDGRLAAITELLCARGFRCVTAQDEMMRKAEAYNLYATRPGA